MHAEADAEVGDVAFAGVLGGENFAFDAASSKAAGNEDAIDAADHFFGAMLFDGFGVDADDVDAGVVEGAGVGEGFVDGLVGVLELDVFADDGDVDGVLGIDDAVDEAFPVCEVGSGGLAHAELVDDEAVNLVVAQVEGALIDRVFDIAEGDDVLFLDVAKHGDFAAIVFVEVVLGAADDDVGLDSDFAQFGDGLLGGLGFDFASGFDEGKKGDVDEADVFAADFEGELAEGFEEEGALDVAHGATDFGDEDFDIGVGFGDVEEALLNLVGDVGNVLHGGAEVFAFALVADDGLEDLAGGKGVELGEFAGGEAFVVTEVEVGFGSVIEDVDFAMLIGRHGAGIDVEVGVELLNHDLVATAFEQGADGGGGESFPE